MLENVLGIDGECDELEQCLTCLALALAQQAKPERIESYGSTLALSVSGLS